MEDTVKFIFKTLIKVPVIITVTYFLINVFGFAASYFKIQGLAYSAMQVGLVNNYIPTNEYDSLHSYMDSMESYVLSDIDFTDNTQTATGTGSGNREGKVQYGNEITVGIKANYKWIMPLTVPEQTADGNGVAGTTDRTAVWKSDSELQAALDDAEHDNNIEISYTIPGLQYYPDLN